MGVILRNKWLSCEKAIKRVLRRNRFCMYVNYTYKMKIMYPLLEKIDMRRMRHPERMPSNGLAGMKDMYKGQSCFIIGNGPSVRMEDLDRIADSGIVSFGANKILDIGNRTKWSPTFLGCYDFQFMRGPMATHTPLEFFHQIENSEVKYAFLSDGLKKYVPESDKIIFIKVPVLTAFQDWVYPFSEHADKFVCDLGTVTIFNIQIAYYLGFKTMYLYGIDNTYIKYLNNDGKFIVRKDMGTSHAAGIKKNWEDETSNKVARNAFEACWYGGYGDKRKNDKGYEACRDFAASHDFKILNATRGGVLEIFPRINFDDIKL